MVIVSLDGNFQVLLRKRFQGLVQQSNYREHHTLVQLYNKYPQSCTFDIHKDYIVTVRILLCSTPHILTTPAFLGGHLQLEHPVDRPRNHL